jgi:HK97 gp10 family phage protein
MSFLSVTHTNPGAVPKRLINWSNVQKNDLVMKAVVNGLDDIYEYVWKSAPVRTGYLRSTIKTFSGEDYAAITVTAYYARFQEKGTVKNKPHPFFYGNIVSHSVDIIMAVRNLYKII